MITSKQRAYLNSLANSIDATIMVGKDGLNDNVIRQADDVITARELIKGKVLETASLTVKEIAKILSDKLSAEIIQIIGKKFILYRKNNKKSKIILPNN